MYALITTTDCSWCTKTKDLLRSKGLTFVEFDLSRSDDIRSFFNSSKFSTVPQIFHNGNHIGGFTQLKAQLGD